MIMPVAVFWFKGLCEHNVNIHPLRVPKVACLVAWSEYVLSAPCSRHQRLSYEKHTGRSLKHYTTLLKLEVH